VTSKWTEKFRALGKKKGTTKDFKDLYFKMKSRAVPIDPLKYLTIQDMMMSGATQSELKKGGLVRKGKPRLTKKGWK